MQAIMQKGLLGLAIIFAVFYISLGLGSQASDDFSSVGDRVFWALVCSLSGAFILAGLRIGKRAPLLGGILVVAGAIPLGFFMVWSM